MCIADGKYLISFTGSVDCLRLPDGITVIADEAFVNSAFLGAVILPRGVVTVGDGAFRWRSELKKAVLPETVRYIGVNAFANCIGAHITLGGAWGTLGENAFPDGTLLEMNIGGRAVDVTLERSVRAGGCPERQLWEFACCPCERTFASLHKAEYKLPCAVAFFGSGECYDSYLRENAVQAVCYAAQRDIGLLEKVLSYDLLDLEQLGMCIDYTSENKLMDSQVVLMRYRGGHFGAEDTAAKRFEL
jgi:hypothetical protein